MLRIDVDTYYVEHNFDTYYTLDGFENNGRHYEGEWIDPDSPTDHQQILIDRWPHRHCITLHVRTWSNVLHEEDLREMFSNGGFPLYVSKDGVRPMPSFRTMMEL